MVFITNVGKEMFAKTRPVIQKTIDTIEKNISKKEKETMILLLKKIQTNFELTLQTL